MSMSNGPAEEEGTENIADVHGEAHEPTDIIQNAFQQLKTYIDSRLENLTKTLQPKGSAESEPLLATRKLQRETEAQKLPIQSQLETVHPQRRGPRPCASSRQLPYSRTPGFS